MGQNICRCVKADSGDDCSSVYGELQSAPTGSTANSRDCLPPPVGSTHGDGSARRDGVKKGRFWKWMKGQKIGQIANEVAVVSADNSTEGDISEQQVSVEVHVDQETLVSEPDGDGSGKRDEVQKKKRFWKWKKSWKARQSGTEAAVVSSDNSTEGLSGQQVNVGVLPSLDRSVANSSEDSFHTPALSFVDLLVNDRQSPVRSVSDSSEDSFHTPALSLADLLVAIPQSLVQPVSDPSIYSIQTPVQSGSSFSDVSQNSGGSRMLFEFDDQCVLDAKNVEEVNSFQYEIGEKLGEGAYGAVYEGTRVKDGLKVAVKLVKKSVDTDYIRIPCHPEPLPREIALLILATTGTPVPEIIQLLDWEDKSDHYVMIQECPSPCMDLHSFCSKGGKVNEALAQIIIWQATIAASVCCDRGVFHRDIKLNNLLINTDTLDVKLIDFGCGDLWKKSKYKIFQGTVEYCCPEFYENFEYHAEPATVWSLGVMLFAMLCGFFPGFQTLDKIKENRWSRRGLSKECCSLIQSCLQENPNRRIRLKDVLLHEWFKISTILKGQELWSSHAARRGDQHQDVPVGDPKEGLRNSD